MKVLCEYSPGGSTHVRGGWGRAFQALGHEFSFWDPRTKSAFDVFHETEPDIFLGTTYGVDRAVFKCIAARPEMKVALFASAWGPLTRSIDREKYPIVIVTDDEKKWIEKLKSETGRPDFVFIHSHGEWLEWTMGGWREIGVKPVGILNAFDSILYAGATRREDLACDVGFVGGYWGYKARNLDKYMLPLCHQSSWLNVKIFGHSGWPVPQYLGTCSHGVNRDLFLSATVCPNVSEPHSSDLGFDCIERPFKVMGVGGFCVSDHVDEFRSLFTEEELPMYKTPAEFIEAVKHFARNPDERRRHIAAGQKAVLKNHTYTHRVEQMLEEFGF